MRARHCSCAAMACSQTSATPFAARLAVTDHPHPMRIVGEWRVVPVRRLETRLRTCLPKYHAARGSRPCVAQSLMPVALARGCGWTEFLC